MNQGATMRFSLTESDDSFAAGGARCVRAGGGRMGWDGIGPDWIIWDDTIYGMRWDMG